MLRNLRSCLVTARDVLRRRVPGPRASSRGQAGRLAVESLEPRLVLDGSSLVINELMALNDNVLADGDGDHSDWIEIHNPTAAPVGLDGWYLTDDATVPTQWQLPAVTLQPYEYRVVFASGKNRRDPLGELHTNFKLAGGGEYLALIQPDGATVEFAYAPQFPQQYEDVSYGLSPDLTVVGYFTSPTPGAPNATEPVDDPNHPIVITEIMYHPPSDVVGENVRQEYIELLNVGAEAVDLAGWRFSNGVDFTFPDVPQVTLAPGQYLVVAADVETFVQTYPVAPGTAAVGGWTGRLSNRGEAIELVNSVGTPVDRVRYADEGDWAIREEGPDDLGHTGWIWTAAHDGEGQSLELINVAMSNSSGQNWAASDPGQGPTPGAANSVAAADVAPLVLEVAHLPVVPRSTDPVTVSARLRDESATGVTATVSYRVDQTPDFIAVPMLDDGRNGDAAPGDGVYTAVLPAQPDGTIVEFYVEATDGAANARTWPAAARTWPAAEEPVYAQAANLLYQVDDAFDPDAVWDPHGQPGYHLIMTEAERAELEDIGNGSGPPGTENDSNSNAQMNATFVSVSGTGMQVRYNVGVRNRGKGSRDNPPNNYRVNFVSERPWQGVAAINVNSKYTHLQFAGSAIMRVAGLAAEDALAMQVRVNGENLAETGPVMYGSYVHLQVPDADFAEQQFPDDAAGNVYRGVSDTHAADLTYLGTDPQAYVNAGYSKTTNTAENDWSDLIHLTDVLSNAPDATYAEEVAEVIDVDQWLRWFAVQALIGNNETNLGNGYGDDYAMYCGVEDPRFVLISHDLDTILGLGSSGASPTASIFAATREPVIDRFLTHPDFVGRYYARLKDLIATVFNPARIQSLLQHALDGYVPASTVAQMVSWTEARNAYVLSVIPDSLTIDPGNRLPLQGGYHLTNLAAETLDGTAPAAETGSVLVNGMPADWSPVDGTWSLEQRPGGSVSDTLVSAGDAVTYHVPTAGDDGHSWTTPEFDDSDWSDVTISGGAGLLITEISTGQTRMVEIENVSRASIDATGWSVLVNAAAAGDINTVGATAWNLPASIAPGEVLYRTDDPADAYWGSEILWDPEGPGWVMILDGAGRVMDFVAWGYGDAEIAAMAIDYGPFTGIAAGDQWSDAGAAVGTVGTGSEPIDAGFVAFNDHIIGAGTHASATTYAANSGGVASGVLKDVNTGLDTGVTLTTSQVGASFGGTSNGPAAGTDAAAVFDGFVDFTSATGSSIELSTAAQYVHAFSGLDPGDVVTYDFSGTAIRGSDSYTNRWTLVTLVGAESATAAHSSGTGVLVVSPTEVAINTGVNDLAGQGYVAAWTGIDPGPDGAFSVVSTQFTGDTPLGPADGNKGYGLAGIRLEEVAPAGPLSWLKRTGAADQDSAADFARDDQTSQGAENPEMTVPFGQAVANRLGLGFSDSQPSFEAIIATDVAAAMQGVSASLWTRVEFAVDDPAEYDTLTLSIQYDDGFIAYLNGTEIARRNAENPPTYDMTASAERDNAQAVILEDIDVSASLGVLRAGNNVLAIHALNVTAGDTDLLMQPELIAEGTVAPTGLFLFEGINRVTVQTFDGPNGTGNLLRRAFFDVLYDPGFLSKNIPGGTLVADLVLDDGPYYVAGPVVVADGVTMTIMPGVDVFFSEEAGLTIQGRLVAEGTETERILLTRNPDATTWDGIEFDGSMNDSRLVCVDMEDANGTGHSIGIDASQVLIDHMTWNVTDDTALELHDSNVIVRNSVFPDTDNDETVHGSGIPSDGYLVFQGNTFGTTTGYSDVIDFTGGKLPNAVIQILDNVFLGGSDDGLDLDGTDAHIEGNVFMHFHQDAPRDSSSNAIATGQNGSDAAEITVVRNFFLDNDHDVLLKEQSSMVAENNTFVGATIASINFDEPNRDVDPGAGAVLLGNIFWDMAALFENHISVPPDPDPAITVDQSIVPAEFLGLGSENVAGDPLLVDPAGGDFRLQIGSPAIGAGLNGLDMGGLVAAGPAFSGEPTSPTSQTDATLTVWGPGMTHYKYRVNGGAWSAETPVGTPIELTGLADGDYTVYAYGRNTAGLWQDEADANASLTWTVEAAAAPAGALPTVGVPDEDDAVKPIEDDSVKDVRDFAGGHIATDTVLSPDGGPYHVLGDVIVDAGATLTIMPGTNLYFDAGTGITVHGRLLAEGSEYQHIRLTRVPGSTSHWDGVALVDSLADSRMCYVDMEFGDSQGESILVDHSQLLVDTMTWAGTDETIIEVEHPSLLARNSVFPGIASGEVVHGEYIEGDEYLILDGNLFEASTSGDDVIDFLGADRPGPVFQVLNNVFLGGGDDGLDLDGTDAHIEGNLFMNFHLNTGRTTTSNAIATGLPQTGEANRTEITVVRNVFYNNDHAILLKEDAFATVVNNLFVDTTLGLIQFYEIGGTSVHGPGSGAYLDGNILVGMATPIFKNIDYHPTDPEFTTLLQMHRTLLPPEHATDAVGSRPGTIMDLGVGNLAEDARLVDLGGGAFGLLPGSPAFGAGSNGLDMGAMVPGGASISGEPPALTSRTDATLVVGGPGITHYKYRLGAGAWSAEKPVDTPVELSGLTDGSYTLFAVGRNSAGVWQDEVDATASLTWTVDTSLARLLINEVLAWNAEDPDSPVTAADRIELRNDGPVAVDLAGMSLSDDPNDPQKFVFPADLPAATTMAPGGYLVLYGDQRGTFNPEEIEGGTAYDPLQLFVGFGLTRTGEGLYLFAPAAEGGGLVDSVEFGHQVPGLSIGRVGHDAQWALNEPTFGSANAAARSGDPSQLKINEWLADAEVLFASDFIEIYNPDPLPVSLAGLYLTDHPYTQRDKHQIVPLSFVPAGGHAVFLADGDTTLGSNHLGFQLSPEQEMIGLYDAALGEIDQIIFFSQTTDVSEGRSPDGVDTYAFFPLPTPSVANPGVSVTTTPLIGIVDVWAYDQSGEDLDTAWREPGFVPDAPWPTGAALLYVEGSAMPAPKSTPLSLGDPQVTTYYFRKTFTLDADPQEVMLQMSTVIDDAAVFYLNGHEVWRLGFNSDTVVDYQTEADRSVGNAVYEGPFTISTEHLQQGENLLAVEVHQVSSTSSDIVFGLTLDATVTAQADARITRGLELLAGLRVTEVMYHPADDGSAEFIELQNVGETTLDVTGVRLAGGVAFAFPPLLLAPGEYVVVVQDRAAFADRYDSGINVAGEYTGNLSNSRDEIVLQLPVPLEAAVLRFEYNDAWYPTTDGGGYALEIRDPAAKPANWRDAESWQAGTLPGGTPGTADGQPAIDVLINEVLTHTDPPLVDTIELHNTTADPIDIGGWYLSDSDADYLKFRIPEGTTIPAFGYVVFDEDDFNPTPLDPGPNDFALDGAHGDEVYLVAAGPDGKPTRFVDYVILGAAKNGESFGRWPNGEGPLYPMSQRTLDPAHGENSGPRTGPVIISEVMYNPGDVTGADDLEFVEIVNPTDAAIDLTGWRVRDGIEFDFAPGDTLGAGRYLVLVPFDPADADQMQAFDAHYVPECGAGKGVADWAEVRGPYVGQLGDDGATIRLQRPDEPPLGEPDFIPRLLEDEVRYDDAAPWPAETDGGGLSLRRVEPYSWGNDAASWAADTPTPGALAYTCSAEVVGRHVFYNRSAFDGNNAAANAQDDNAIAADKQPLLPGQTATFANYTSYVRGINGVMIDIQGLPQGTALEADDFLFRVGNSNDSGTWDTAPAPTGISVRPVAGGDRVTLVWDDYAIAKQWLQVTVLATADTGLLTDDVFYFGNAVGEAGNSTLDARVNATDMLLARNNPRNFLNPAEIDFPYDFNRDARVNATDMLIARNNQTHFLNALKLITVPGVKSAESASLDAGWEKTIAEEAATPQSSLAAMAWLYEFERLQAKPSPAKDAEATDQAIGALLADLR
ncbi:MAG: lamin tail domain-containing protein [Pirellulales bacterium]|nr:lamin tail domain-containing protein [Pirellulales bacterium]